MLEHKSVVSKFEDDISVLEVLVSLYMPSEGDVVLRTTVVNHFAYCYTYAWYIAYSIYHRSRSFHKQKNFHS